MAATILDEFVTTYDFKVNKRPLRGLEARIDKLRRGMERAARPIAVVGTAVTGALFAVGRGLIGFDREINRLQRDTGATEEQLARMRARVIELGSSADYTTISVNDAARGLRELAKGGLTIEQAMAALPDVLNLVAATEIDVGEAASKTAKIMKGLGLEIEDIPRIHDLIAHAQVSTGITAEQMIDTLLRVAPTARAANVGIDQLVSTLAILVDQGQISERAATSLERALVVLSKADVLEPKAQEAFKELGVDIETISDLMNQGKFIGALRLLSEAGLDVSTASRIFGEDGQRAVLTLAAEIPRLEEFRGSLEDIEGTMRQQAGTMNKGLSGAWAAFLSSLSAAREALGDAGLRGWMERAAITARRLVEEFTALPPEVQRIAAYALAAGPALIAMGGALQALSWALAGFVPMLSAVGLLFSWWVLPLAAVGTAALLVVRNWDQVVAFFTERFPRVVAFIEELPARARRAWAAVMDGSILEWVRGWDTGNVQQVVTEWYRRIADRFRELDWRDVGRYAAVARACTLRSRWVSTRCRWCRHGSIESGRGCRRSIGRRSASASAAPSATRSSRSGARGWISGPASRRWTARPSAAS